MNHNLKYCENFSNYKRLNSLEVNIGGIALGGNNPIRIQSMTNTNTLDTDASVEQTIRLALAGSDYVRLTASSTKEAENLAFIKKKLKEKGFSTPLIADIHYNPKAAEIAARTVEKIRINPGNFHDRNLEVKKIYSDKDYVEELEKIQEKLLPLIKVCKQYGTAIRIGTNHGSLSHRVVGRYGDTPKGMVYSTLEFLKMFEDENFKNIVISLKSSNTLVMIEAYRLLAQQMIQNNRIYPLHLGVTEAGNYDEGRIKSAFGIGTLLADGIGDTIRVSLSEPPENEIPVAKKIIKYISEIANEKQNTENTFPNYSPYEFIKRNTSTVLHSGSQKQPSVVLNEVNNINFIEKNYSFNKDSEIWNKTENSPEYLFRKNSEFLTDNYIIESENNFFQFIDTDKVIEYDCWEKLKSANNLILIISGKNIHKSRLFINKLIAEKVNLPVILKISTGFKDKDQALVETSIKAGFLLADGLINGIWIDSDDDIELTHKTALNILQASRQRFSTTEYIICPTCGRTQFDIQKVSDVIKEYTNHLKGIKIAVIGCIVNGIGEMADADYGYVGMGNGKISLYKGKTLVRKGIEEDKALNELIALINESGDWK
ncbi:MAG: 4-hydroxy-3-methylbut-2-en-1-yl diphosphate synthase [Bacteroidetes bacterium GWA2_31_9]|nr:MAG: 4-hydroxy-3-methylbut-2-en-1-yl diphosphate synthase [Bacteroidetes bacterium GWA2_31_9]